MGHATIYADQELVLGFINELLEAGDDDFAILIAGHSPAAIIALGHQVTTEDLAQAVRYLNLVVGEDGPLPENDLACIALIRNIFSVPSGEHAAIA